MFVAINIIKNDSDLINSYPIIFENNIDDISVIDQIKENYVFRSFIEKNIHFSFFNKIKICLCYIADNDSQYYYESEYQLTDIFNINDIYSWEAFVKEEMKNLAKISLKVNDITDDIQEIYNRLLQKFPNKINKDVVINYICSQLKEKYPDLSLEQISYISNKFKTNIV